MSDSIRERDLKNMESITDLKTSFRYISAQLETVIENQKKHYQTHDDRHGQVLLLIKVQGERLTKVEAERGLVGKIMAPVAGFLAGFAGGYFGRHT